VKDRVTQPCPNCHVGHALFGNINPQLWQALDIGLSQLPMSEAIELVNKVRDAQTELIAAARDAAFESGAVEVDDRCPDTVEQALTQVRLRINE
jgi:hypothetical protein